MANQRWLPWYPMASEYCSKSEKGAYIRPASAMQGFYSQLHCYTVSRLHEWNDQYLGEQVIHKKRHIYNW